MRRNTTTNYNCSVVAHTLSDLATFSWHSLFQQMPHVPTASTRNPPPKSHDWGSRDEVWESYCLQEPATLRDGRGWVPCWRRKKHFVVWDNSQDISHTNCQSCWRDWALPMAVTCPITQPLSAFFPFFPTSSFPCGYCLVRPSYIICEVRCKLKFQSSLLKNCYSFKTVIAAKSSTRPFRTQALVWSHRCQVYKAGPVFGRIHSQMNCLHFSLLRICVWETQTMTQRHSRNIWEGRQQLHFYSLNV